MRHQVPSLGSLLLTLLLSLLAPGHPGLLPRGPAPSGPAGSTGIRAPTAASPRLPRVAQRPSPNVEPRPPDSHDPGARAQPGSHRPEPERTGPGTIGPDAGPHLDRAPREVVRRTLERALERARVDRGLFVAPEVVDHAVGQGRVGIVFGTGSETRASRAAFASLLSGPTADARWAGLRLFPLLDHGSARVGPQALLQLIGSDRVLRIELDGIHRPALTASVPRIRADLAHQLEADGDGQTIAILDTGLDPDHPMLAGRIVDEACFSVERDCPNGEDEMLGPGAGAPCPFACGHGTLVAGIAAGNDPGAGLVGVAPRAQLISIQVFSDIDGTPGAYTSDILAGLQHVLALTAYYEIAAVNLSLASEMLFSSSQSCDDSIGSQRLAIERLRQAGVTSVAAAGNEGRSDRLAAPACLSNVLSVGSSSLRDRLSGFSNVAAFLALLAPGEGIETARQGGGTGFTSGTSMATAHVAGAIALLREASPSATVGELQNALGLTGVPIRIPGQDLAIPRIDVEAARALLTSTLGPDPEPVGSEQEDGTGGDFTDAANPGRGGGGGGGCGLIGIEPLGVLVLLRLRPRRRSRRTPRPRRCVAPTASS